MRSITSYPFSGGQFTLSLPHDSKILGIVSTSISAELVIELGEGCYSSFNFVTVCNMGQVPQDPLKRFIATYVKDGSIYALYWI